MAERPLPAPLSVAQIPGGYKVLDATEQTLCEVKAREMPQDGVSLTEQ